MQENSQTKTHKKTNQNKNQEKIKIKRSQVNQVLKKRNEIKNLQHEVQIN